MNKRIILVGRGTSGKDYLRKRFDARGYNYQISYTTRPPRDTEIDGIDYHFINDNDVARMTQNDEWNHLIFFNGWAYGTTKEQFHNTQYGLFIFTPEAVALIKPEDRKNSFIIFLDPPDEVILRRLQERSMPGDTANRRFLADVEQFKNYTDYDIRITTSDW